MAISYPQVKLSAAKSAFRDLLSNAQETFQEDGIQILGEGFADVISDESTFNRYRDVMLENCEADDAEQISQILDNSRWETLQESVSGITPISSLSCPAIRALWPRLALKNAIPTEVVKAPKFTLSYIIPYLKDAEGRKYQLPRGIVGDDAEADSTTWKMGQHLFRDWLSLSDASVAASVRKAGGFNLLYGGADGTDATKLLSWHGHEARPGFDHIDPDFSICAVKTAELFVKKAKTAGNAVYTKDAAVAESGSGATAPSADFVSIGQLVFTVYGRCELRGSLSYELSKRVSAQALKAGYNGNAAVADIAADDERVFLIEDTLFGKVDFEACNLKMASSAGIADAIKVSGRLTFENNERTESVIFEIETKDITIGTGIHIDAPLPNEFLSDVSVLYSIDGVAKVIDILTQTIATRLDQEIKDYIIRGYKRQTDRAGMELFHAFFNCRPDDRYNGTPKDWREQIKLSIDYFANVLKQRNYFQGGKFVIVGNPVDCAIIPNTSWSFTGSTTERSGIEVDYDVGAISGSQRYEVVSSQLVPAGALFILYVSSQDEQMTYKYYPYSFLVTRDMRNAQQLLIPNITMCKRHKLEYFHDAMIKVTIANNNGATSWQNFAEHGGITGNVPPQKVSVTDGEVNKQIFNTPPNIV